MFSDYDIEEWRREAKEQGPGIYGFMDEDFNSIYIQVDTIGRARRLDGEIPLTGGLIDLFMHPGMKVPKFPLTYRHGYERAVADEHAMLMIGNYIRN